MRYQLRTNGAVDAILWNGKASDLATLPNFNQIAQSIESIDKSGHMVFFDSNGDEHHCYVEKVYILVSGEDVWVMPQKEFEEKYESVPEMYKPPVYSKRDGA